jgi:hypothetical protein
MDQSISGLLRLLNIVKYFLTFAPQAVLAANVGPLRVGAASRRARAYKDSRRIRSRNRKVDLDQSAFNLSVWNQRLVEAGGVMLREGRILRLANRLSTFGAGHTASSFTPVDQPRSSR